MVTTEKPKKEKYTCACGIRITRGYNVIHEKGPKHQDWINRQAEMPKSPTIAVPAENLLSPDLQTIIDCDEGPVMKAKMTRAAFAARDWPNPDHPGTVQDFLKEHLIPYYDFPKGGNMAERKQNVTAWEKEMRYGKQ